MSSPNPPSKNPFSPLSKTLASKPDRPSDGGSGGGTIVPSSPKPAETAPPPAPVQSIRHGLASPIFCVYISWLRGNLLQVACLRPPEPEEEGHGEEAGGKVVEVKLGGGDGGKEIDEARRRRIAYGSLPAFALLQSRTNSPLRMDMAALPFPPPPRLTTLLLRRHFSDDASPAPCLLRSPPTSQTKVLVQVGDILDRGEDEIAINSTTFVMKGVVFEEHSVLN